jgi:hypothetical protein
MNIRAKIYGGVPDEPILRAKRRKGAKADALDSVTVPREEHRKDSRYEGRHRLLDQRVPLTHGRSTHEVQLINLSGGGAMIGDAPELILWDKVQLHLGEEGTIECAVRWIREDRVGLEFAHETRIDCGKDQQAAILREVVRRSFPDLQFEADTQSAPEPDHSGPDERAAKRHPLVWSGLLHHDYQSTPVRLRNISATGALIECPETLTVGSEPLLELGEELSISAKVAWVLGDQAGLRFDSPFNLHDLAEARPDVTGIDWEPPSYLSNDVAKDPSSDERWGRMSLGQLHQELQGFLKH